MKFVHLTTRDAIGKIKKNGIRMSAGRSGKGVYAVPLMLVKYISFMQEELDGDLVVNSKLLSKSTYISTSKLWHWWKSTEGHSRGIHKKVAAIVFELPSTHWPLDILIEDWGCSTQKIIGFLENKDQLFPISQKHIVTVKDILFQGYGHDLTIPVNNPKGLGEIMNYLRGIRYSFGYHSDQSLEVIVRKNIPPSCLKRIVTFYGNNSRFRYKRHALY